MATVISAPPIAPAIPTQPAPSVPAELYRFNVDEYERMALDDPRVERINGYVVTKVPENSMQSRTTEASLEALERPIPPGWTSRQEPPARIPDFDQPEPDVAIVRGTDDDSKHRHPGPAEVGLLVEVSGATPDRDRNEKLPADARARSHIYWIINPVGRQAEVHTDPGPDGYRSSRMVTPGQAIPVVIDGRPMWQVAVDDILG